MSDCFPTEERIRELLRPTEQAVLEYHVVIVGRAGEHDGTDIYLIGPGTKKSAIQTGQQNFRRTKRLATSIQLVSHVAYSGNEEGGKTFMKTLMEMMELKEAGHD